MIEIAEALLLELAAGCTKPRDVADRLEMLGCKGQFRVHCACPVAVYLQRHGLPNVFVGWDVALVRGSSGRPLERTGLPKVVIGFVEHFDAGHFPELMGEAS